MRNAAAACARICVGFMAPCAADKHFYGRMGAFSPALHRLLLFCTSGRCRSIIRTMQRGPSGGVLKWLHGQHYYLTH